MTTPGSPKSGPPNAGSPNAGSPKSGSLNAGSINTVVMMLADPDLRRSAERAAAAAGLRVRVADKPTRRLWLAASAILLDHRSALCCRGQELPRRAGVVLLGSGDVPPAMWESAIAIGAQRLYTLPAQEAELARELSEAAEAHSGACGRGPVIAVTAGRGGAGASVFAVALAQTADEALLIDLDPFGGGIDLLVGSESATGLRWPDLSVLGGRLNWTAVRDALPRQHRVSVLSAARHPCEIDPEPVGAIVDAGRRGGATVVCDVPRRMDDTTACALDRADLVVAITTSDVRGVAAMSALAPALRSANPNVGLVVRGPAPGGLRASDIADASDLPLIAAMRPEPMLAPQLERGGLRLRRRSPLGTAARRVLALVDGPARLAAA